MRKILLSMALVAASGAYVGHENLAASAPPVAKAAGLSEGSPPAASNVPSLTATPLPAPSATTGPVTFSTGEAAATSAATPSIPLPRLRPTEVPTAETTSAAAQAQTQATVRYSDGTFKGIDANAYYGHVQVEAVIKGGQITTVNILDYPSDRRTSRNINSEALPILEQEVIQAQSANIDGVSGATLTSEAFAQSLDAALLAATSGNNA